MNTNGISKGKGKGKADLQTIVNRFLPDYQQHHTMSFQQRHVCHQITQCRTAALGGQAVECSHCDFTQIRYHSCRNRHCPKCQQRATQQWVEQQTASLLPAPYFHLVFTLPHELNAIIKRHDDQLYPLLFQAAWETIRQLGADKKRLNGQMGMTAMLHTWGQNLSQHVHLHCLIPGGALAKDKQHWHPASSDYLFPVRALSRLFRGKMVSLLRTTLIEKQLLSSNQTGQLLDKLMAKDWVVYARSTLTNAKSVVAYLARYTHKSAISNHRICDVDKQHVSFKWKDYRDGKQKVLQLGGEEFLRRYLLHVLPKGFMRVRHYGFLANRCRRDNATRITAAIHRQSTQTKENIAVNSDTGKQVAMPDSTDEKMTTDTTCCPCPKCHQGILLVRGLVSPQYRQTATLINH